MEVPVVKKHDAAQLERASRTQTIIYIVMGVLMVLPFVVAWLAGALQF